MFRLKTTVLDQHRMRSAWHLRIRNREREPTSNRAKASECAPETCRIADAMKQSITLRQAA
jgi:hypothetical protein